MSNKALPTVLPKETIPPRPVVVQTTSNDSRARKNATVACQACKTARTRCEPSQPCPRCVAENIECVRDETQDGRRSRKRLLTEISTKADALEILLTSLKASDDQSFQDLLHLIRTDRPLDEIIQQAKLVLNRNELRKKSQARVRHAVLSIASLVDEPPFRVPARPWTSVLQDDGAVSHLISVYFTWHHHGYPSLDPEIFVREMNGKDLSSQFCSPFLVNSLLFVSCMYTDHPAAFADPENRSTRGIHFMEESIRLWTLEAGHPSLVNLQALPAFISGLVTLGKDQVGTFHATQSFALASELVRSVKRARRLDREDVSTLEFSRSYDLALSAISCLQTEIAIAWMKPFDLKAPSSKYQEHEFRQPAFWQPYPMNAPRTVFYPHAVNHARARLFAIVSQILPVVLSGSAQDSPIPNHVILNPADKLTRLALIEQNLDNWYHSLPESVQVDAASDVIPPGPLVDLHLAYHGFHVTTHSLVLRVRDREDDGRQNAERALLRAIDNIALLLRWLQRNLTFKHYGIYTGHASSLAAFHIFDFLDRPGCAENFHMVIVALTAVATRWTLFRGILKIIWITLNERGLIKYIEPATVDLLKVGAVETWHPKDHQLFEKCAYPNYAAIDERGRDLVELGDLLQQYADLGRDEKQSADPAVS